MSRQRYFISFFFLTACLFGYAQNKSLDNLLQVSGGRTLVGHHDSYLYGSAGPYSGRNSDIALICGRYPAVLSVDFSGIELGWTTYSGMFPFKQIRNEIIEHHRCGGFITASWHTHHPLKGGTFTNTNDRQIINKMLHDEQVNATFMKYLERLAEYILTLRDDDGKLIPIFFRPWHECNGNWFFWGTDCCTDEEYVQLWKTTCEYLKSKGCSNLYYVFSPGSYFKNSAEYMKRYPGNDYIDMLGFEAYRNNSLKKKDSRKEFITRMHKNLTMIDSLSRALNKPYAITETGIKANSDSKWWTKAFLPSIKGFCPIFVTLWANDWRSTASTWATYKGEKSASNFKRMSKSKQMIFLNK